VPPPLERNGCIVVGIFTLFRWELGTGTLPGVVGYPYRKISGSVGVGPTARRITLYGVAPMRTMRKLKVLAAELEIQRIFAPKASEQMWLVGG